MTPARSQVRVAPSWTDTWLPRAAWASLAVNVLIVVTGGVVRLTGSGLGCPTWPRCTQDAFTPHDALSIHSAIEFGNRLVTFLIAAVAIATFVVARKAKRRGVTRLAAVLALGVPLQALLGGVTVLVELNPWVVAGHLLLSMAMISLATLLVVRVREPDGPAVRAVPESVDRLLWVGYAVGWVVLYLGTVVTGSGPHAGDADAPRNGLDPRAVSQLHVDFVMVLLGLTIATVLVLRAVDAPERARQASVLLLAVILGQGTVGFVQYFTDLPIVLVTFHLFGSALVAAAMTYLLLGRRTRLPA